MSTATGALVIHKALTGACSVTHKASNGETLTWRLTVTNGTNEIQTVDILDVAPCGTGDLTWVGDAANAATGTPIADGTGPQFAGQIVINPLQTQTYDVSADVNAAPFCGWVTNVVRYWQAGDKEASYAGAPPISVSAEDSPWDPGDPSAPDQMQMLYELLPQGAKAGLLADRISKGRNLTDLFIMVETLAAAAGETWPLP